MAVMSKQVSALKYSENVTESNCSGNEHVFPKKVSQPDLSGGIPMLLTSSEASEESASCITPRTCRAETCFICAHLYDDHVTAECTNCGEKSLTICAIRCCRCNFKTCGCPRRRI